MRYLTWWFILLSFSLKAQLPNYSFEYISNRDDLPSNTVNSICEDKDGFLWLATRRCLSRYDGYSFKNYNTRNIWDVTSDKNGDIYYTTEANQLLKFNQKTLKSEIAVAEKEGGSVSTFTDSDGNIWFSDRFGVNKYDVRTKKNKFYPLKKTTYIWHKGFFVEDSKKNVWILGYEVGLLKYDKKEDKLICKVGLDCPKPAFKENNSFSRGIIDKNDVIWAATFSHGLFRYDTRTDTFRYVQLPNNEAVVSVCESSDEANNPFFWVGTARRICVFYPKTEKYYFPAAILPYDYTVNNIFKSKKNNIVWFCTSEGLIKYNPENQTIKSSSIPIELQKNADNVHCFLKDNFQPNIYWVGLSRGGLLRWNRQDNSTKYFPFPAFPNQAETNWMIYDKDGKILIGSNQWQSWADGKTDSTDNRFEGIFKFDTRIEKYQPLPFKIHHQFFSVPFYSLGMIDHKNRLWLTNHYEGIRIIDLKTNQKIELWEKQTHNALMNNYSNWVMDVFEDSNQRIWLATNQGIFYFDEPQRKFINIQNLHQNKLTESAILKITEDKKGYLWATGWHILLKFDKQGKILGQWSEKDGIYDAESKRIVVDEKNRVWLGTYDGLHVFDEAKKAFRRFTVNDGLLSNKTISGFYINQNELLVGNRNGWNLIDLQKLDFIQDVDNLSISSIKVNNHELAFDQIDEIILGRNQNAISFEFSALNFKKSNDNRYSYYLEGLENDWIDAQNAHQVSYNNLSPQDYTFHVRNANAFGTWNPREIRIRFSIKPAYYETWWFRLLIVGAFAGLIYAFYRYRINQLLKLQAIRENISRDLHDEIGASLSGIGILSKIASQKLDKTHPSFQHLERITQDAQNIGASMDDIVWSINPQNDGLDNIIARMNRYASELLEAKDVHYQLITNNIDEKLKLSMEQRRDIYLIFKEAINNILKYAQCKKVVVEIKAENRFFEMKIIDDGIGIDLAQKAFGNGLQNMRKRAENLDGKLGIQSSVGEGTTVQLNLTI